MMRVSCIQTNPQSNLDANMSFILSQIVEVAKGGSEVVILPEMFSYMGDENFRKSTKDKIGEGVFLQLQNIARELKINLIGGSHSETVEECPDKVYNTCLSINPKGELLSIYNKLHLFNLKNKEGKSIYCESAVFQEGIPPKTYKIENEGISWNALNIICYDIRFPEIIRSLKSSIDILFVPAAFTWQTGKDHWEVLLRARAIENQCYVVACNQTGFFLNGEKRIYGNSMVVDPWGLVVARLGEEVGVLNVDISKEVIAQCRMKLPALMDRRI